MEQLLKQMMEQMNQQFKKMDNRFDRVEASIASLRETVENHALEFRSHFRHIEDK